jgi:hypothetical protein
MNRPTNRTIVRFTLVQVIVVTAACSSSGVTRRHVPIACAGTEHRVCSTVGPSTQCSCASRGELERAVARFGASYDTRFRARLD